LKLRGAKRRKWREFVDLNVDEPAVFDSVGLVVVIIEVIAFLGVDSSIGGAVGGTRFV
jgi:hypothetical protein